MGWDGSVALGCEKRKDYAAAMEVYMNCLNDCNAASSMGNNFNLTSGSSASADTLALPFMRELRGEIMLRIAVVKKDLGAVDQAMIMCNNILAEHCCESVRANTLCLKVCLSAYAAAAGLHWTYSSPFLSHPYQLFNRVCSTKSGMSSRPPRWSIGPCCRYRAATRQLSSDWEGCI